MSEYTTQEDTHNAGGPTPGTALAIGGDADGSREGSAASPKQQAANKANARRSTGPKTKAGKAHVSQNAVKHALRGRFQLIVGEEPNQHLEFHDRLCREFRPVGAMEEEVAERVIGAFWRLRRIERMESEMIDKVLEDAARQKLNNSYQCQRNPVETIFGAELASPEHDLSRISLGEAVMRQIANSDVIGKLHRYEAHIERGLFRALHELQRLQAVRQGQVVPAPIALDITTDQDRET